MTARPVTSTLADGRQWISLGILFGGHSYEVHSSPLTGPVPGEELPPSRDSVAQAESAEWEMRQAGYDLDEDYPGSPSIRWSVTCSACSAPRKVSLQSVRRGARCHCGYVPSSR